MNNKLYIHTTEGKDVPPTPKWSDGHNCDLVEDFKNKIYELFTNQNLDYQGVIISNLRHYEALENANKELVKVKTGLDNNTSGDFLAMDIRQALQYIGTITGEISSDELLGNIFANFCIGK